eukprot:362154-Chlamydomonas_euryale.AAC.5
MPPPFMLPAACDPCWKRGREGLLTVHEDCLEPFWNPVGTRTWTVQSWSGSLSTRNSGLNSPCEVRCAEWRAEHPTTCCPYFDLKRMGNHSPTTVLVVLRNNSVVLTHAQCIAHD